MLNLTSSPPEAVAVNGTSYPIEWDYRTWIDISVKLEDVDFDSDDEAVQRDNIILISGIIYEAFGKLIDEPYVDSFSAILEFLKGYPTMKNELGGMGQSDERLFSFKYDINYIILAIRNQSGIDLSYRRSDKFHWWEFLLEFASLEEHHCISKIIGYRAYKGKDRDMLRLKAMYELPKRKSEQKIIDDIDNIFYNS